MGHIVWENSHKVSRHVLWIYELPQHVSQVLDVTIRFDTSPLVFHLSKKIDGAMSSLFLLYFKQAIGTYVRRVSSIVESTIVYYIRQLTIGRLSLDDSVVLIANRIQQTIWFIPVLLFWSVLVKNYGIRVTKGGLVLVQVDAKFCTRNLLSRLTIDDTYLFGHIEEHKLLSKLDQMLLNFVYYDTPFKAFPVIEQLRLNIVLWDPGIYYTILTLTDHLLYMSSSSTVWDPGRKYRTLSCILTWNFILTAAAIFSYLCSHLDVNAMRKLCCAIILAGSIHSLWSQLPLIGSCHPFLYFVIQELLFCEVLIIATTPLENLEDKVLHSGEGNVMNMDKHHGPVRIETRQAIGPRAELITFQTIVQPNTSLVLNPG